MTTVKINLDDSNGYSSAGSDWVKILPGDTTAVALTDVNGDPTGWTIRWSAGFAPGAGGGGYNAVGVGAAAWVTDPEVFQHSVFHNSFSSNDYSELIVEGPDELTISAAGSYQDSTSHPDTEIWVNSETAQVIDTYDSANSRGNNSDAAVFSGVLKDGSNQFVIRFRDFSGDRGYLSGLQLVAPAAADTTAPTFSSAPAVTATTDSGHSIGATLNEAGTIYGVRLANGATAPSAAQVKAGQDSTGSAALEAKSGAAANSATLTFSTGSASTAYDYYIVAEDDEGTPNLQATPTLVEATTSATQVAGLPAYTLNKDGSVIGDVTGVRVRVTATGEIDGTELYSVNDATTTSGVMSQIDLSATAAAVGDTVTVEILTGANEGIVFSDVVEDIA